MLMIVHHGDERAQKRGRYKGDIATHVKCAIAATRKTLKVCGKVHSVRLLAAHQCQPGSIPVRVNLGFSHMGIVPYDATGQRVFSGVSRFRRPFIPALLMPTHLTSPSSLFKISLLKSLYSLIQLLDYTRRVKRDEYGAALESKGGGNGRSLRKPADQRLRERQVVWPLCHRGHSLRVLSRVYGLQVFTFKTNNEPRLCLYVLGSELECSVIVVPCVPIGFSAETSLVDNGPLSSGVALRWGCFEEGTRVHLCPDQGLPACLPSYPPRLGQQIVDSSKALTCLQTYPLPKNLNWPCLPVYLLPLCSPRLYFCLAVDLSGCWYQELDVHIQNDIKCPLQCQVLTAKTTPDVHSENDAKHPLQFLTSTTASRLVPKKNLQTAHMVCLLSLDENLQHMRRAFMSRRLEQLIEARIIPEVVIDDSGVEEVDSEATTEIL
ncbi:hypothetical protein PR048_002268 [Dryococelus australis]|uniref:Uncharacterized protein n=1 Tax=Dryococelus australis TaxID=614101 RepID=A0ABQ9IJT8_9NEOP|nr:hypothetical protein PR048_002268 [Dryococelus australis]